MSNTVLTPSPSAVVYAAGDQFAAPRKNRLTGYGLPCSEALVDPEGLAVAIVSAGFACMAARGLITLGIAEFKRMLVMHTEHAVVQRVPGAADLPAHGVDAWLIKAIPERQIKVHDAVRGAYGEDVPGPSGVPIFFASKELQEAGYYNFEEREDKGVGGLLRKAVHAAPKTHQVAIPIPERFADLREQAPAVKQLLEAARSADPHLWAIMEKDVCDAIRSRQEVQETGPVGD